LTKGTFCAKLFCEKKFSFYEKLLEARMPKELSTLAKGIRILSLFDEIRPIIDVSAISTLLNLPKSTAYRYIATLKSQGLIEEDTKPGHYRLGLKILELSWVARKNLDILNIALPVMKELMEKTQETVFLFVPYGQKAVCIERIESPHPLRLTFERGRTLFLHAGASAKILMAYLSEEEQKKIIREIGLPKLTERTIVDPERLKVELQDIRKRGYAVSHGEVDPTSRAIGAPILDEYGKIIAGVSIAGPKHRFNESKLKSFIPIVVEAANRITQQLIKAGEH